VNGLCYKILPILDYESSAMLDCYNNHDGADLLLFNNDAEVKGFVDILKKGK
jgi:hypothetical protein